MGRIEPTTYTANFGEYKKSPRPLIDHSAPGQGKGPTDK